MNRETALPMLHKLELAFRPIPAERMGMFCDMLIRKHVTEQQLGDAILKAIETCERFPSIAQLLEFAQPKTENAPRREEKPLDLAEILDAEEVALRGHARVQTLKGNMDVARDIQRRIDRIWQARASRGLSSKLRPSVENFDGTPLMNVERDWTEEDLIQTGGTEIGYPNALSKRAGERLEQVIRDRGWGPSFYVAPPLDKHAKPVKWTGDQGKDEERLDEWSEDR